MVVSSLATNAVGEWTMRLLFVFAVAISLLGVVSCTKKSELDPLLPAETIGNIEIDQTPDVLPGANWTLSGPRFETGSGDTLLASMEAGVYTVSWSPVADYNSPATSTQTLAAADSVTFDGVFTIRPADLAILVEPEDVLVPWVLSDSDGFERTGVGADEVADLHPGSYQLDVGYVAGWLLPEPAVLEIELLPGESDVLSIALEKERRLTFEAEATDPSLSTDGQYVAFVGRSLGDDDDIIVYSFDTGEFQAMTNDNGVCNDRSPSWGAGGFDILYDSNNELWLASYPSGNTERIDPNCYSGYCKEPTWSLGSNRAYFVVAPCIISMDMSVYWDCDEVTCGYEAEYLSEPDVSPDGEVVLFAEEFMSSPQSNILAFDQSVNTLQNITTGPHYDESPSWSSSGEWICFSSDRGTGQHLWIVDRSGESYLQVTFGEGEDTQPDWGLDDKAIVFSRKTNGVSDLWLVAPPVLE